jgi:predicted nucleotidyltransferase
MKSRMKELETIIRKFFDSLEGIVSVDLFGSYAQNRQTEMSDVDIAVLWERNSVPEPLKQISWREELSTRLNKSVDLVCLNTASPIIGMQVLQHRKNILMKNQYQYENYQMVLFTSYADLKILRAPMEKNILNRKYYT